MAFAISLCYGQYHNNVGINTDQPEQRLHVKGSMKAKDLLLDQNTNLQTIPSLGPTENYSFLLKSRSAKRITTYNVQSSGGNSFPAPFGVIGFTISTDPNDKDWVNEYDTRINATKYIAVLNYFNFNLPVVVGSSKKISPAAQVFTYEKDGTWWIKADYHGFAPPANSSNGVWDINLMVFDKTFAKSFTTNVDFNGNTTGVAPSPLILK